ncbi:hypothetical protein DH2020_005586 [Rehmannia glutinosa]|uniref:Protein LURP-one-related 17 n=1 Tax=Rehmannia glutinosa TaxID=99300 RepID=A0ABR0XGI0_REHGL
MLHFLKSTSRTVHIQDHDEHYYNKKDSNETCISLTVWRKSLIFSCSGFTVIGSDGSLAYRVDNYTGRPDQVVLMDGWGNPIFTICRRKKLWLVDNYWLVYEGEIGKNCKNMNNNIKSSKKPVFCVRKNVSIIRQTKLDVLAYVYSEMSDKRQTYIVEGSYTHRSCKILDESKRVLGEIKKKEGMSSSVSFGLEVFHLMVKPGFESRFAMAIVLLLDQMFS